MSWHHGNCKACYRPSADELCPRCEARMDEEADQPRPRFNPAPSNVRIPYDPDTDPF